MTGRCIDGETKISFTPRQLVTLIGILLAAAGAFIHLQIAIGQASERINGITQQVAPIEKSITQHEERVKTLEKGLDKIDEKLDRLIELGQKHKK